MRRSTLRDQTKSRVCKKNIKKLEGKKKTKLEFINIYMTCTTCILKILSSTIPKADQGFAYFLILIYYNWGL